MRFLDSPRPLLVLIGPTAVGKTEIALQLASRLNGEIVSANSRLFYRGMDIGTAKPARAELERVRHHLIDVADPDETWSLAVFQREAHKVITSIQAEGRLPLLVGGTGQYVWGVIEGWEVPAQTPDPGLRIAIEKWAGEIGVYGLHQRLGILDPDAAERIDPRNLRRTIRALEVIFRTGQRFSVQRLKNPSPYSLLLVGLTRPREELYARVDARIEAMMASGFEEEVRELLAKGYSPDLPTLSAIGYREMVAVIRGEITREEAVVQMKRLTRQFVRRQANWFKESDPAIHWFRVGPGTVDEIERLVRSADLPF